MALGVLNTIAQELQLVNAKIGKYFQVRSGYLGEFAHLELDRTDQILRPACVLSVAGHFKCKGSQAVAMAAIIQLIFLADRIHSAVPEDEEPGKSEITDPRDSSQLPVLVGDYLYGRFFTTLSEEDILEYLEPLARMICVINEGGIQRSKAVHQGDHSQQSLVRIIEKESGLFMAESCRISASMGGATPDQEKLLWDFGFNLGMAYGVMREPDCHELSAEYVARARAALGGLEEDIFVNQLVSLVDNLAPDTIQT